MSSSACLGCEEKKAEEELITSWGCYVSDEGQSRQPCLSLDYAQGTTECALPRDALLAWRPKEGTWALLPFPAGIYLIPSYIFSVMIY